MATQNTHEIVLELVALLKESAKLGLDFEIGRAYISRSYIDHQMELRQRIAAVIAKVSE